MALLTATACGSGAGTVRRDRNGISIGPISVHWMQRQRKAQLYYPGSKRFYQLSGSSAETSGSESDHRLQLKA